MFRTRGDTLGDPDFPPRESAETTSLSAIDRDGNAASLTYSLNIHSGVVTPGTGILLNNQMLLLNPWPGSRNSVAPGKRPASSMMPTLVCENGRVTLALGASGSTRIASAILQTIENRFTAGLSLPEAVAAPRLHAEGHRLLAARALADLATALAAELGLDLTVLDDGDPAMGSVQAVAVSGSTMEAVGDPRSGAVGRVL